MIAYLRGKVIEYGEEWVLVGTESGVGYQVFVADKTRETLRQSGIQAQLHTYLSVKEDGWALYGFIEREEKETFELLLRVAGVGPRVALSVLATLSLAQVQRSIREENLDLLTKVPGIGKKTAQRMVLELKEKITNLSLASSEPVTEVNQEGGQEAREFLLALGYTSLEANQALENVLRKENQGQNKNTEEIVRLALKYLSP